MSAELVPCPFCGHDPTLSREKVGYGRSDYRYFITCQCEIPLVDDCDRQAAIREWNSRAGPSHVKWFRFDDRPEGLSGQLLFYRGGDMLDYEYGVGYLDAHGNPVGINFQPELVAEFPDPFPVPPKASRAILGRTAVDKTHEDMAEAHGRRVDEALLGLREPEPKPEEYTPAPLLDMGSLGGQYRNLLGFRISMTSPPGDLLNHPMVKYAGRYVGGMADSFSWDVHKLAKMPTGDLEKLLNLLRK